MSAAGSKATIRFSGPWIRPQAAGDAGAWILLSLPKNANSKLPPGTMQIEGTLNGFPFRVALEPNGHGSRRLKASQALREAAGEDAGGNVTVEITRAGDEPEVRVPADLRKSLGASSAVIALWEQITPMARRDWVRWITSAKQEETRRRRIEAACDMLSSGKRRPCCFPGINFVTKGHVPSDETWLPLPSVRNRSTSKSAN